MGRPHRYTELEFKYLRKSASASYAGHKIRSKIYKWVARYYENKNYKRFMSS